MKQRTFSEGLKALIQWLQRNKARTLLIPGAAAAVAVIMISCATLNRTVLEPPRIPGASYIGSEACAECHEEIVRDFKTADHARLNAQRDQPPTPAGKTDAKDAKLIRADGKLNIGCESCHGPGSVHKESGGARGTIVNPKKSPDACFQCHLEVKARFQLPSRHPVLEGRMSCVDCHHPHKGRVLVSDRISLNRQDDTCGKCHEAQRGPFVFEHEAVREGCTICHQPHGSVNAKMLVNRNQMLCLRCHFQQQTANGIYIGSRDHSSLLQRGTCWSAGCHEAVHGSQTGSSLRF